MSLLQIILTLTALFLIIVSFTTKKGKRFNLAHFFMFFTMGIGLLVFIFYPDVLNIFGKIFGVEKGADVLVYVGIIFLGYSALNVFRRLDSQAEDLTMLIRNLAIETSEKRELNSELVFLVRVYNEEKVLSTTLDELVNSNFGNILVVNDGSSDYSINILKGYGDKIFLVNHLKNRGGGAALETGFEYIRRFGKNIKYVCTFDADGQHQLKDLSKFLKKLDSDNNLNVVFGSRFITHTSTNVGIIRKIILKLGIFFTYFISNIKLTDAHNGYRVFKSSIIKELKLTIDGMGYASEMIDIISDKNIKFAEVPVDIIYTEYSMQKGQKSSNAINIALKMIWNKFLK